MLVLCRDDPGATDVLNDFVLGHVVEQISQPRVGQNLASSVRPEILLLSDSLRMEDSCWEQRLRTGRWVVVVGGGGGGGGGECHEA